MLRAVLPTGSDGGGGGGIADSDTRATDMGGGAETLKHNGVGIGRGNIYMGLDIWIWMGKNPFLGPFEGVGPESLDFFVPKWHSLRSLPFKGPKSLDFQGPPLQTALVMDLPPSKSIRPAPYKQQVH